MSLPHARAGVARPSLWLAQGALHTSRAQRRRLTLLSVALLLAACGGPSGPSPSPSPSAPVSYCTAAPSAYATAVVDWWLPNCSIAKNSLNDPRQALGAPDADDAGGRYSGFVSLGFGGYVTVDLGGCVSDQAGNDLRVYQAVSSEPLSVYVSESPEGPYTLLRPRQSCGERVNRVIKYCDFDLAEAAVPRARYVKVQDGEMYPCPGDTDTEGADFDAVRALSVAAP